MPIKLTAAHFVKLTAARFAKSFIYQFQKLVREVTTMQNRLSEDEDDEDE